MQKQLSEGFIKKDVMRNFAEFAGKNLCQNLFLVFSCQFCETCKITFFAEQHRTTASEYSREHCIVNETVNYDTKTKALEVSKNSNKTFFTEHDPQNCSDPRPITSLNE